MGVILKNNAVSTITTAISASDVGLAVAAGTGTLFPTLGASDYFYATLVSAGGTYEVIKVTARVGDTMTIVRAQEGTTAQSFASGSRIEVRVTAASITDMVDEHDQASEIVLTPSGYTTADDVQEGFDNLGSSGGSTKVGFLQAGSGAVARTAQSKMRDVVSVKDFGAVGDGVTDDTAAIQAAAAAGLPLDLVDGVYSISSAVTIINDIRGPGKLISPTSMLVVGANDVTVDGVSFEGTAASGTAVPLAVGSINYSGLTVRNCHIKDARVWARNTAFSRLTDFRFQNNTVDADFSLIEHIINQNDVLTVRGIDGVWITNNDFTVTNVHRVLKIADTEAATTFGTDYRARNVFVTGNRIVGSTDSGKQVMDLYFFTSDITIAQNLIEVTGFSSVIENKTGEAQNYNQNTFIVCNKLSNDKAAIILQGSYGATTPGYDVGYQNSIISDNTIISTTSTLAIANIPVDIRFYDNIQFTGNNVIAPSVFTSSTGLPTLRFLSNAYTTVSNNSVTNGAIWFGTAITNQAGQPFVSAVNSIICNGNTVSNFGGTAIFGGVLMEGLASSPNARVLIEGNYIKQDVDDGASAGCVAVNNSTINTLSVTGNTGVMANFAEQRLRILSSTISAVLESENSWNQIGRASATYDPPSILAGGTDTTTLTVTGAAPATDVVSRVQFSRALAGLVMTAWVSATDTVTVQLYNPTASPIDLASGSLQVVVSRFTAV